MWISRNSTVIQVVSAHREREAAEATLAEIKRVAMLGDLFDEEEVLSIFDRLYKAGDSKPEPLSSETIRTICRNIEDAVWKREQERDSSGRYFHSSSEEKGEGTHELL